MVRTFALWFLLLALFRLSACAASTVHGHFINAGERNYDLIDGVKVICSDIAPGDSCDFTITLGSHALAADPRGFSKKDYLSKDYMGHEGLLPLNIQHHDYTFKVWTEHHNAVIAPEGSGLPSVAAYDMTHLDIVP